MHTTAHSLLGLLVLLLLGFGAIWSSHHIDTTATAAMSATPMPSDGRATTAPSASLNSQLREQLAQLSNSLDRVAADLAIERASNAPLRKKVREIIDSEIVAQSQIEERDAQLGRLRSQVRKLRADLESATNTVASLQRKLTSATDHMASQKATIAKQTSEIGTRAANMDMLKEQVVRAEESVRTHARTIAETEKKLRSSQKQTQALAAEASGLRQQLDTLTHQLEGERKARAASPEQ